MSKTNDAIAYMKKNKCTAYKAAKFLNINQSLISRELKRRDYELKNKCPTCGHVIKTL